MWYNFTSKITDWQLLKTILAKPASIFQITQNLTNNSGKLLKTMRSSIPVDRKAQKAFWPLNGKITLMGAVSFEEYSPEI